MRFGFEQKLFYRRARSEPEAVATRSFGVFRVYSWIVFTAGVEQPINEVTRNDTKPFQNRPVYQVHYPVPEGAIASGPVISPP